MTETPNTETEITSVPPMDQLTSFEVAMAERAAGIPLDALADESGTVIKTPLWTALAWVHHKRSEPTLTYDQYAKRVRPDQVMDFLFPKTEAADEGDPNAEPAAGAPFHAAGSAVDEVDRGGASPDESSDLSPVGDSTE